MSSINVNKTDRLYYNGNRYYRAYLGDKMWYGISNEQLADWTLLIRAATMPLYESEYVSYTYDENRYHQYHFKVRKCPLFSPGLLTPDEYLSPYISYIYDIVFPNAITEVYDKSCYQLSNLTSISLPNVTSIGEYAFYYCTSLTILDMPNVKSIGNNAFEVCGTLTALEIPSVETIGNSAFRSSKFTSISLQNVLSIGEYSFASCVNLRQASMPNVKSIGNSAFRNDSALQIVDIPNVETIDDYAFYQCRGITDVNMTLVRSIGYAAFYRCSAVASIDIRNTTSIGEFAFYSCNKLTAVYLPDDPPTNVNSSAFVNNSSSLRFYVSSQAVKDAYLARLDWQYHSSSEFVVMT